MTISVLEERISSFDAKMAQTESKLSDVKTLRQKLNEASIALSGLMGTISDSSVESLLRVVNSGLASAYSRPIKLDVIRSVVGGRSSMQLVLLDGGEPVIPGEAHGGGLSEILGFLIRVVCVSSSKDRRILILDEPFGRVSEDIVPTLASLLRSIVDDMGFQLILITHQEALSEHADVVVRTYGPGKAEILRGN